MRTLTWRLALGISLLAIGIVLMVGGCTWQSNSDTLRPIELSVTPFSTPTRVIPELDTSPVVKATLPTEGSSLTGIPRLTPNPRPFPTSVPTATDVPTPVTLSGTLIYVAAPHNIENGVLSLSEIAHLYSLNLESGESQRLTTGDHHNLQPVWSPDGKQVAFISDRDSNLELYVMNADGSEVIRLTDSVESEGHPTWSPDGTQIAFDRIQELPDLGKTSDLYVVKLSDKSVRQLTNSPDNDYHPSWSPDGQYLAFNRDVLHIEDDQRSFEPYIYLLDMRDGAQISLTKALFDQVPFTTAEGWQQVWLMDPLWLPVSGNTLLSLTQLPARCNEGGVIAVFELDWGFTPPRLGKLIEINGGYEGYTWGPSGMWIISPEYDYHSQNVPSSQPDLSARYIGNSLPQSGLSASTSNPIAQQALCLGFEEIDWLTETTLYESAPSWKP